MAPIDPESLDILRHATGWPKDYRNHYVAGDGNDSWARLLELETAGLVERFPRPGFIPEGDVVFAVTETGKRVILEHNPLPPVRSESARRYDDFRDLREVAPDLTFRDYLRRQLYRRERRPAWAA